MDSSTVLIIGGIALIVLVPYLTFKFGVHAYLSASQEARRVIGIVTGVLAILCWFFPFNGFYFGGLFVTQSGVEFGGIAYVLLLSGVAFVVATWIANSLLRVVFALSGLAVSLYLAYRIGSLINLGLIGELAVFLLATLFAHWDRTQFGDRSLTKKCEYCAETIKAAATVCRFCDKELNAQGKGT